MFHCLVIKVVCLATALLFYHVVFSLSRTFLSFFQTLFSTFCSFQQLFEFIITLSLCQELFLSFFRKKRRRRDLNPRAAINDLLPFQGSPFGQLGYFSKLPYLLSSSLCCLLSYESLFSITDVS